MAGNRQGSPHARAGRPDGPATDNLCLVLAIDQLGALAEGRVSPAIHTEEEA